MIHCKDTIFSSNRHQEMYPRFCLILHTTSDYDLLFQFIWRNSVMFHFTHVKVWQIWEPDCWLYNGWPGSHSKPQPSHKLWDHIPISAGWHSNPRNFLCRMWRWILDLFFINQLFQFIWRNSVMFHFTHVKVWQIWEPDCWLYNGWPGSHSKPQPSHKLWDHIPISAGWHSNPRNFLCRMWRWILDLFFINQLFQFIWRNSVMFHFTHVKVWQIWEPDCWLYNGWPGSHSKPQPSHKLWDHIPISAGWHSNPRNFLCRMWRWILDLFFINQLFHKFWQHKKHLHDNFNFIGLKKCYMLYLGSFNLMLLRYLT